MVALSIAIELATVTVAARTIVVVNQPVHANLAVSVAPTEVMQIELKQAEQALKLALPTPRFLVANPEEC